MGRGYCWKLSPWMSGNWMFTLPTIYSKPPKDSKTIFHKKYYRLSWKKYFGATVSALGQSHGHCFMPQTLQIAPEKWGSFKRMIRFPPEFTKVIQTKWSMMSFWWPASLLWLEVSLFFSVPWIFSQKKVRPCLSQSHFCLCKKKDCIFSERNLACLPFLKILFQKTLIIQNSFSRKSTYPLVNIQKTMENHHFQWVNPL